MPRPTFTPTTAEQRVTLAKLDELAARIQRDTKELWETIEKARRIGIAKEEIARRASGAVSRATIYRRFGETAPDSDESGRE